MIVCIGDVMVDVFTTGGPERRHPGGKASIYAVTARTLGSPAAVIGCVGADPDGDAVVQALTAAQVDVGGLVIRETETTGADFLRGDDDWHMERGANWALTAEDVRAGLAGFNAGPGIDAVVVNQGVGWPAGQEAVRFARGHDLFTVLHLGPEAIEAQRKIPAENYPLADVIVVSLREAKVLAEHLDLDVAGRPDIEVARTLFDATGPRWAFLLSRGVDGAVLVIRDGDEVAAHVVAGREVRTREPEFFIGAGDTMLGAWVAGLTAARRHGPVPGRQAADLLDEAAGRAARTLDFAGPLTAALAVPRG